MFSAFISQTTNINMNIWRTYKSHKLIYFFLIFRYTKKNTRRAFSVLNSFEKPESIKHHKTQNYQIKGRHTSAWYSNFSPAVSVSSFSATEASQRTETRLSLLWSFHFKPLEERPFLRSPFWGRKALLKLKTPLGFLTVKGDEEGKEAREAVAKLLLRTGAIWALDRVAGEDIYFT